MRKYLFSLTFFIVLLSRGISVNMVLKKYNTSLFICPVKIWLRYIFVLQFQKKVLYY